VAGAIAAALATAGVAAGCLLGVNYEKVAALPDAGTDGSAGAAGSAGFAGAAGVGGSSADAAAGSGGTAGGGG
jgi:hypothetical protein